MEPLCVILATFYKSKIILNFLKNFFESDTYFETTEKSYVI